MGQSPKRAAGLLSLPWPYLCFSFLSMASQSVLENSIPPRSTKKNLTFIEDLQRYTNSSLTNSIYLLFVIFIYLSLSKDFTSWSGQFSSVAQSCLTLCDPMNYSMPGLPVHQQLPEFTQTCGHKMPNTISNLY